MKAVLMSIQPKWCEKIFSGKMTIKVRKTAPKLETPFKVYVYCTNGLFDITDIYDLTSESVRVVSEGRGKVIGEFVCDRVEKYDIDLGGNYYRISDEDSIQACVDQTSLFKYGNGRDLYGWRISEPKLYDKPKELGEFSRYGYKDIEHAGSGCVFCGNTQCEHSNPEEVVAGHYIPPICKIGGCTLKRVPQSWQYVEEIVE